MPAGQEEQQTPAHRQAADGDESIGFGLVCKWLSDNNRQEFSKFLLDYSTDSAAVFFACSRFLRFVVRQGHADEMSLIQTNCIADTLRGTYERAVSLSPDDYDHSEMWRVAKNVVQKIRMDVTAELENSQAAAGQDEDAGERQVEMVLSSSAIDERVDDSSNETADQAGGQLSFARVLEVSAEVKADQRHVLNEFIVDHTATLLAAFEAASKAVTDAKSDNRDIPSGQVEALLPFLRGALTCLVHRLPENLSIEVRRTSNSHLRDMGCNGTGHDEGTTDDVEEQDTEGQDSVATGGQDDDAQDQDTVAALRAQLKKQEEDYAAQLEKYKEEADAKLKGVEEELNKDSRALREGTIDPDTGNTSQANHETSDREEKLKEENDAMQNVIATLQAKLKAAEDGVLAINGNYCSSTIEMEDRPGKSVPESADGGDDENQIEDSNEGSMPAEDVEITIPDDDDEAETSPSPSGVTDHEVLLAIRALQVGDVAAAAADEGGISFADTDPRERNKGVSDKIVSRLRAEVDKFASGTQEKYDRNLVAVTFPSLLDSVVDSAVHWARGEVPIEDILRIATDLFDLVGMNQEVNEQAELQISTSNQRIRRGCLGAMMHALNASIGEEDAQNTDELVEAGKRAVTDLRRTENENWTCDTVAELAQATKLGECGRSILNSVLHLVSVVEALREKEVSTITEFGSQGKKRGTVDRKKADEAALKAAFADFCPGATWNDCRASVLVCAMMKFLAGENLDERRKERAIAAMAVIFDKRLVLDNELWARVDAFSLGDEPSEQKFFTISGKSANRRRYSALHYMLMFCLGGQIGEAIKATDDDSVEFEWFRSGNKSFQQLFLLCSVEKNRVYITDLGAVKSHLFGTSGKVLEDAALDDGIITDCDAIRSIRALLEFIKGRHDGKRDKRGEYRKFPFGADMDILFDLDVLAVGESLEAAAGRVERLYIGS